MKIKQIEKNKLIKVIVISLIIIVGIIITCTIGLNIEMPLREHKEIELNIGKEFNESDIKQITNEVFGKQEVIIQKVEVFEDTVLISTNEITEEQKSNLVTKVNEKYNIELNAEEQQIQTASKNRLRDILNKEVMTFIIATIIILVYFIIRYSKLKISKIIIKTLLALGISESLIFSIIAITRIPVGRNITSIILAIYIIVLYILTVDYEKKLEKIKLQESNNKEEKGK